MKYEFDPEAREEFDRAVDFFNDERMGLGLEFVDEVERTIERILESPSTHPRHAGDEEIRYRRTKRFHYVILFAVADELVRIVAVAHTSRRPGYWRDRLN